MKGYVCITGVSSGIGRASAGLLSRQGYRVIGSVRNHEDGQTLQRELGSSFQYFLLDISQEESISEFVKNVEAACGETGLKALVNNSGIAIGGPLMYIDEDELRNQFEVNVIGLMILTKRLFPMLRTSLNSRIINLSSVSGILTHPFLGPYSASKFALEALSDALRKELMPFGIKVVVIQAGAVQSPIWKKSLDLSSKYESTPYSAQMKKLRKYISRTEDGAISTEVISRAILKAVEARRVRNRYFIHGNKPSIWLMKYCLPDKWLDALTYRYLFDGKRLD